MDSLPLLTETLSWRKQRWPDNIWGFRYYTYIDSSIMPPLEKQNSFVVFAKQVDKSKAQVQKALDETQVLFDSLMQEYFG